MRSRHLVNYKVGNQDKVPNRGPSYCASDDQGCASLLSSWGEQDIGSA